MNAGMRVTIQVHDNSVFDVNGQRDVAKKTVCIMKQFLSLLVHSARDVMRSIITAWMVNNQQPPPRGEKE